MEKHNGDIVDVHRQVLKKLCFPGENSQKLLEEDPEMALLQHRLISLRKRSRQLLSDLKKHEFEEQVMPLSEEMKLDDRRKREFDHLLESSSSSVSNHQQRRCCTNTEEIRESSLAQRMQSLRKRRRRVGSHRVGGISILPCPADRNLLGIRLDICVQGQYTQKHVIFFDIVTLVEDGKEENEKSYWLRLVRHTLPRIVTLQKVIDRHLGGAMLHLSEEGVVTENTMNTIQELVGDLYDICYAMAIRRKGVEYLQSLQHDDDETSEQDSIRGSFTFVKELIFSETLQCIIFNLILKEDARELTLKVDLQYHSETAALPSYVEVSVTDNTLDGQENKLIKKLTQAFRSKPIWQAFKSGNPIR
mmetsp:Transcript_22004/g.32503  ORF Transcript_22004/g.32503 Transcript_22004/m.32503 type:complete len:361 (-) Transcript_22004:208-1290(-)